MARNETKPLSESWFWKQRNPAIQDVLGEWQTLPGPTPGISPDETIPVTQESTLARWYPTETGNLLSEIHAELLKRGAIPDPYIGFGEHEIQCTFSFSPPTSLSDLNSVVRDRRCGMAFWLFVHPEISQQPEGSHTQFRRP